jgi:N-acyl-D-amino-acid deacylase
MHDLVIRNGKIIDGSGFPAFIGDIGIDGEKITWVGGKAEAGRKEIDASGFIVTPGWVDIHTHYDAQVTWDPYLSPSSWHGVTTVVMGNCGVGFAPARPDKHDWLIDLMEGVEDIPGTAMHEGIKWGWESFPEYMNAIEKIPHAIDFGVLVPHGPVRAYVMSDRGAKNEDATAEDIGKMHDIVRESLEAGALGFSTSRTMIHRSKSGELVPGTFANEQEIFGIGRALKGIKDSVFQMTANHIGMDKEFDWMRRLAAEMDCTVTFNLLQTDENPHLWQKLLKLSEETAEQGIKVFPQVAGRPAGILMSWEGTAHPFLFYPTYQSIAALPFPERLEKLRSPEIKSKILSETPVDMGDFANFITRGFHKMFPLDENPDYEPSPDKSFMAVAQKVGKAPAELAYDYLLRNEGKAIIYFPIFNYSHNDISHLREMFLHPQSFISLGDGGAHCGAICDASIPTFMLTHWVRDRQRGDKLPLEFVVKLQTKDTSTLYGLNDRGLIAPGMKADINVIDFDNLRLYAPEMVYDLPAEGRRLIQKVDGYKATVVSGQVILENSEPTGVMPGKLLRGSTQV